MGASNTGTPRVQSPKISTAPTAAAAAAFNSSNPEKRPNLRVVPPRRNSDSKRSIKEVTDVVPKELPEPSHFSLDPVYLTSEVAPMLPTEVFESLKPSATLLAGTYRLWFRKKSGGPATSLLVSPHELVDDVKTRILQKYPTSLQQRIDPADLVLTIPQPSGIRLELQPDEEITEVIDRHFQGEMRMSDALEIGPAVAFWNGSQFGSSAHSSVGMQTPAHTPGISGGPISGPVSGPISGQISGQVPFTNAGYIAGPISSSSSASASASALGLGVSAGSKNQGEAARGSRSAMQRTRSFGQAVSSPPFVGASPLATTGYPFPQTFSSSTVSLPPNPSNSTANSTPTAPHPPDLIRSPSYTQHVGSSHTNLSKSSRSNSNATLSGAQSDIEPDDIVTVQLVPKPPTSKPLSRSSSRASSAVALAAAAAAVSSQKGISHSQPQDDASASAGAGTDSGEVKWKLASPPLEVSPSAVVPQIKMLIVEDNRINQRILERFLKVKQIRFDVAQNGREALDKWKTGEFHLILMDIQLPVMTGLEATREIRRLESVNGIGSNGEWAAHERHPPQPHDVIPMSSGGFRSPVIIVALTASSDSDDLTDALAAGCNDFLTKPVNFAWLERKITEWGCMQALIDFDGWRSWNVEPAVGS